MYGSRNKIQSLKPELNGLFCERIFGPINDFECSCGKKPTNSQKFCPTCNVEFTYSKVRRYRLGFIQLFSPTTHAWYLKGRPSYISILLNFSRREAESLAYCTDFLIGSIFPTGSRLMFYQFPSSTDLSLKFRYLKKIKNKLFINSASQPLNLDIDINIENFLFPSINLTFFPIKNCIELQQGKKSYQSKKDIIKNTYFKRRSINKIDNKSENNSFTRFKLNSFFNSTKYWKLKNKNSIFLKKNKKDNKLKFQPKDKKGGKIFKKSNNEQICFISYYYSISKSFCWEDFVNSTHFIYYMTSLPKINDLNVFHYQLSNKHNLGKFSNHIGVGAKIFNNFLNGLSQNSKLQNLWALERQIRINFFEATEIPSATELVERVKLLRRLKIVWYFRRTKNRPSWMILSILPVLPPDLRPIIQLEGNQIAISDLNKLYQKVLFRNRRIQKLKIGHYSSTSEEIQYAQRLLQESVDCLIESSRGNTSPTSNLNNRPLKSLSDILKGKKGRFRQNLLGKRVDYSGRSVIVVGPHLRVHECGIPKEMALELFQPFLVRSLISQKRARTILGAKKLIQKGNPVIYKILNEIVQNYPVLLNRAPTLHRLSIQSFQPRLVEGRAIILHPLVCSSFNADFDGDQMAVHIPLSIQARAEAWKLLWSQNNLLSPATGQPALIPTQDIVLGWYYLTAIDPKNFYSNLIKKMKLKINSSIIAQISNFYKFKKFKNKGKVLSFYNQKKLSINTPIWFFWKGFLETDKKNHSLLEIQLFKNGDLALLSNEFELRYNWFGLKISQFIFTTVGRIILNDCIK